MKKRLSSRELQAEFLRGVYRALDGIVTDETARRNLRTVAARTQLVTVPGEYVSKGIDVKTYGENIQQMVVFPGFARVVRRAYIVLPEGVLKKIASLRSGNPNERREAEDAMQVVAHETVHTFLNSIDYERSRARYYLKNPKLLTREMAQQILEAGVIRDRREAIKKAQKLVDRRPIFIAGCVAHAEDEFASDAIGADLVTRLVRGRRPTARELIRFTWRRPTPVRAILQEHLRGISQREKKPFLESVAHIWNTSSERIYKMMGEVEGMGKLRHPERTGVIEFPHRRRMPRFERRLPRAA